MSKLEELIKEFCPNGVEHVKLCDVADFRAGSSFPEREQGKKAGRYPFYKVVDMNKTQIYMEKADNYINEETCTKLKCKPAPKGTIIFPKVGATMGTNKKRILSIEACYDNNIMGLFAKNIDPKFLYYCFSKVALLSLANGKGAVPSLDTEKMARIQIPLPALPVQREIVRILDSFTLYSAELTAELTARRKQYEFYRDKLLRFESGNIPRVKLKDIATEFYRGYGITREQVTKEGIPCVRYGEIYTTYNTWFDKCVSYTKVEDIASPKYFEYGDILFAITGESVEDIAKSAAYIGNEKCLAGGDIVVMKHKQNPKFLAYALSTFDARQQKSKGKIKSKVVHSNVPSIENIEIYLPPIDVQERIVKVLDNFDAICSDLGIGLPAEIEKRQKQYEYYREKLLTFDGKYATILTERNGTERNGTERNGTERNGTERNGTGRAD